MARSYAPVVSALLRHNGLAVVERHRREGVYVANSGPGHVLVGAVIDESSAQEKALIDEAVEILTRDGRYDLDRRTHNHLYVSRKD